MNNLSEALFASLMFHRRRKDGELRRNDLDDDLRAAQTRQRKRS